MRYSHLLKTAAVIGLATSLTGCASLQKSFDDFKLDVSRKDETPALMSKVILEIDEPIQEERPIQIEFFEPIVMPDFIKKAQMKLRPASYVTTGPVLKPFEAIDQANASASIEPNSSNYLNAI